MMRARGALSKSAEQLLARLAGKPVPPRRGRRPAASRHERDLASLVAADLLARTPGGGFQVTAAGHAHLARSAHAGTNSPIDSFRAQHLDLAERNHDLARRRVIVDESESPLAWLARRKGSDGRPFIAPEQFQAGERLRADFTCAQLMPRTTSNWTAPLNDDRRGAAAPAVFTETVVAARQRLRRAVEAVGPEFSGLLLDVCCFLKGLADVERDRGWPPRTAKVVLQLGLDRLARHYGLSGAAHGRTRAPMRAWVAPETGLIDEEE